MKIIISKSAIEWAAKQLSKVINAKNALPILGDIYCLVDDNGLTMMASDSEVTLRTTIQPEKVEGAGHFCVSADKLIKALSELDEQPLTITTDDNNQFNIQHLLGNTFFPMDDADTYPLSVSETWDKMLTVDSMAVRDAIKRSLWATAIDDLRPVMNGVCFNIADEYLDVVASDGRVLVRNRMANHNVEATVCFIMPRKAANIMAAIINVDEPTKVNVNEHNCDVEMGQFTMTTRLIEGKYPNYNAIFPTTYSRSASVLRNFLMNNIRNVMPFANEIGSGTKMVRMTFSTENNGMLELQGENIDFFMGATCKFDIDYEGEPLTIGVNGKDLLSILSKLEGEECYITMNEANQAIIIEPKENSGDCEVRMLTMPVLLND